MISRIPLAQFRSRRRILLIGRTANDRLNQLFLTPPLFHQVDGEPIKQFAILGSHCSGTKVFGRLDQPLSKDRLPDPIHRNPRRKRRTFVRQPLCKLQSPCRICGRRQGMKGCRNMRMHHLLRTIPTPPFQQMSWTNFVTTSLGQMQHRGQCRRIPLPLCVDFIIHPFQVRGGQPPRSKNGLVLLGRSFGDGGLHGEYRGVVDRCCGGKGGLGEADAGTHQHLTAAQHKFQFRSGGKIQRLFELNHGNRRLIASSDAAIGFPRGVIGAVDQITDRPF